MKEIREILTLRASRPDLPYALATVVKVEGSSYRKPGARMLIGSLGRLAGSVSGGCLEKDVISRGLAVILCGARQIAVYDTTDQDDLAFGSSLGCEGRIEILIEPILPAQPWALAQAVDAILRTRKLAVLATVFQGEGGGAEWTGSLALLVGEETGSWGEDIFALPGLRDDFARVAATKKPLTLSYPMEGGRVDVLVERIAPPMPLIIFGGGHDVPPLVRLAKELGHHVTVIDRRVDFADPQRFPGADVVIHARPAEVLSRVSLGSDAAAVVMNHHYETDAELLGLLLGTPVGYLGMLGPRKRTGKILEELRRGGLVVAESAMENVHAPAGLDIGSENPEQIALSILAEIQSIMTGRSGSNLRGSPAWVVAA